MEEIIILLIIFGFSTLAIKMVLNFAKWKTMQKNTARVLEEGGGVGNSLGVSELRSLIQDAVLDANEPLLERIRLLEDELIQPKELAATEEPRRLEEPRRRERVR